MSARDRLYIIRGPDGKPEAIHQRTDRPDGKAFAWWSAGPDGQPVKGLQGRGVDSLPLFGSQHVASWDTSRPVYVVEGERAVLALAAAGHRALGTVCGAGVTPGPGPLAVLIGLRVVLWPDNDEAGRRHMQMVAGVIRPGVQSVGWAEWPGAPAKADAADYLAAGLRVEGLAIGPVPAIRTAVYRPPRIAWRQVSLAPRQDIAPLAQAVRRAGDGNRNALLFWAARRAADDGIGQEVAEGQLLDAFLAGGPTTMRMREGRATIRSAYRR